MLPAPARIAVKRPVWGSKLCLVTTPLPAVCWVSRNAAAPAFVVQ